jgi:hypothetical protein
MRKFIQISFLLAVFIIFCGCAQSYRAINPSNIGYTSSMDLQDIILSYRYDVLNEKGNTKFSKKERKNNVKVVAVKIKNNSDRIVNIGKNAAFYNGNAILYPLDALTTRNALKQSVPSHLLYLLLSPLTLSVNGSDPFPIGLILGPAISGGNMIAAGSANNDFYNELSQYDILYRDINPGETVYGLVGFSNMNYAPLSIKLIE